MNLSATRLLGAQLAGKRRSDREKHKLYVIP
jgi:hypothetical protein